MIVSREGDEVDGDDDCDEEGDFYDDLDKEEEEEDDNDDDDDDDDDGELCRSVSPSVQAGCPPRSPCTEPGHSHFKDDNEDNDRN